MKQPRNWAPKFYKLAHETRDELARRFPLAITPDGSKCKKPLKLGIHLELIEACPDIDPRTIRLMLSLYTDGRRYSEALLEGAERVGLDGVAAGIVTAAQAKRASAFLAALAQREAA